jgi:prephenate dehydrogenase
MRIRSIGIVGYGNFGAFVHVLVKRFAPGVTVRVHSADRKPDGKTFFTLAGVAQSDAVILAVPIHTFERVLPKLAPLLGKETVLVDVATVKVHTENLLKKFARNRPYIATHPMFGPESYEKRAKNVAGFRIVVTSHTLPPNTYRSLLAFVRTCGFSVIEMSAKQHDTHLAETLFLTHFVAQIVTGAQFDRTDIDTVSFGFLMDAVETVRANTQLFRDVYAYNPYCKRMLQKFAISEKKVRTLLART